MRNFFKIVLVVSSVFLLSPDPQAQQVPPSGPALSLDEFIDRLTKAEAALTARLGDYHPVVEVYLQNLAPDPKVGTVPVRDDYFLGQFEGKEGPDATPLSPGRGWFRPAGLMNRPFGLEYVPSGFAATTIPDRKIFDRTRYDFTFVRREFLDEVRCLVLEVRPKGGDN